MAVKKFCCVQRGEKTPPEAYVSQSAHVVCFGRVHKQELNRYPRVTAQLGLHYPN